MRRSQYPSSLAIGTYAEMCSKAHAYLDAAEEFLVSVRYAMHYEESVHLACMCTACAYIILPTLCLAYSRCIPYMPSTYTDFTTRFLAVSLPSVDMFVQVRRPMSNSRKGSYEADVRCKPDRCGTAQTRRDSPCSCSKHHQTQILPVTTSHPDPFRLLVQATGVARKATIVIPDRGLHTWENHKKCVLVYAAAKHLLQ
jgi:hypothetical protein